MYQSGLRRIGVAMLILTITVPLAAAADVGEDRNRWAISAWAVNWWAAVAVSWANESAEPSGQQGRGSEAKDGESREEGPEPHQRHYLQLEPGG